MTQHAIRDDINEFMSRSRPMLIGGQWVPSSSGSRTPTPQLANTVNRLACSER